VSLKDASGDEEGESDRRGRLFPSGPYPLASRLVYHLRCLREDATDLYQTALERLTLVRDRAVRIQEIRRELGAAKAVDADGRVADTR